MNDKISAKTSLNINIADNDFLSELTTISMEFSLSLEDFILYSIEKTIYDIRFIRKMRTVNKYKKS